MLALLLVGSTVAWLQTFRALEYEPRAILAAQQVASLVNLSRAALIHSDAIARVSLIKTLADQEALRILPREPGDRWDPFTQNDLDQRISDELARRLGPGTVVASRVNGTEGLWVGFLIERDSYWLQVDRSRVSPLGSKTWMIWLVVAAALSLTGAAIIARLIASLCCCPPESRPASWLARSFRMGKYAYICSMSLATPSRSVRV